MAVLPSSLHEHCDSLSCLHALEHFGLGRYADPINPQGHVVGLTNLYKMLAPGGTLYLSFPIGPQRTEFNAQRVFSLKYALQFVGSLFVLTSFSYVDDDGDFHAGVELTASAVARNLDCRYGCGIFELRKR